MIEDRKLDHINICLKERVESARSTGFEDVTLVHRAFPGLDMAEVSLEAEFLGRRVAAPFMISGMTGGERKLAKEVNANLARAAQEFGIPMGVGSQRAAIKDPALEDTYSIVRDEAPDAFLVANLGAVQFVKDYGIEEAERAVEMIDADALAVHFNPLQEAVQVEGDTDFSDYDALEELKGLKLPLIAKETGAGIAREEAGRFQELGFSAIDTAGLGGTSFSAVESYREGNRHGAAFRDWGIPTAVSVVECARAADLFVIASGGIRTGIHMAKALALGASACGVALPLLEKAVKGAGEVLAGLERMADELRIAMFLAGAGTVDELDRCDVIIGGKTLQWLTLRGIDCNTYANRR
ncbi:MAG: type 2 isopentenyl-diphosphate Delta-isomerase [Euryarchaeota archaeon]|nr:type 2 isopentenyl-diphosphate Delta-isomerase [Euryarchaeota archaeon]